MSRVKVYTTETCVFCHLEMEWLDELGVDYEEVDARGTHFAAVPVTEIDGEIIEGFNRPALKRALKKAGLYAKK
ncbi:glutaredoxin family protein [Candidatus Saccharibacteria bacterium]|nr:glutaredoxin family protein [Candidatus Saccharibacteria bacterium]